MCFTKDMQVRGGKQAGIVNFPRKKKTLVKSNILFQSKN